ncbi:MAG: gamma-glutamyltransferase [Cyanobacteria bacterium P01_F01_bin.53]
MAGVVASGHEKTAEAGRLILEVGGNAFDAAVAACFMACVAESTLTSLGGGGFLLAHEANGASLKGHGAGDASGNTLFDFFTQTPGHREEVAKPDFYPIEANFGDTVQEFHIGLASMAVPGMLAGLLTVHRQLGCLPLSVVVEPAVDCARMGLPVNAFQSSVYEVLAPILSASAGSREIYAPQGKLLQSGDWLRMPQFAELLEHLASLGDEGALRAFYEGEIAQQIVRDCQAGGGYLSLEDFRAYEVKVRSPLAINYRGVQMLTNPPPSAGGSLIAFCLELLDRFELKKMTFGSVEHLLLLSQAMRQTNEARRLHLDPSLLDPALLDADIADKFVAADLVDKYAQPLQEIFSQEVNRWGSTTHISVMDDDGNAASVTTSNGEGSSYVISGTQIMMNNMLGEEDLNPQGFNQWPCNQRMSSMMAPTMILRDNKPQLVLGSGGSNRIRTAIVQVISNILDFGMPLAQAVEAARIHWERGVFHLEPGFASVSDGLAANGLDLSLFESVELGTDQVVQWQQPNMFFGGVHSVGVGTAGILQGAGDFRRSGAVARSE